MAASGYHGAAMKSINGRSRAGPEIRFRADAPSFGVCQQNTGDV
jgi:hypothetical protein